MKIPRTFKIKKCRLCHNPKLKQIHNFGNVFVSNFVKKKDIKRGVKVYKFDKSSLESLFDNPFDTIRNMKLPKSNKKTSEFIGSVLDDNSDDEMMEDSD